MASTAVRRVVLGTRRRRHHDLARPHILSGMVRTRAGDGRAPSTSKESGVPDLAKRMPIDGDQQVREITSDAD
jgi:hypothetical protein